MTPDLDKLIRTAESARLAIRQAGPHTGLHGPAAACMDKDLIELRNWLAEVADNRRKRLERDGGTGGQVE